MRGTMGFASFEALCLGPRWGPLHLGVCVSETYAGFIDVGFLRGEGAKAIGLKPAMVRPYAAAMVNWFRQLGAGILAGETFL